MEINPDNEELTKLRNEYGPLVSESVAKCVLEIEEWNPSGRYIWPMPWNFEADKMATMNEIIDHLELVIIAKEKDVETKKLELKAKERDLKAKELECVAMMKDLRAKDGDSSSKVKIGTGVKTVSGVGPKRKRGQS